MKLSLNLASRSYVNRRALYVFYALATAVMILLLLFNGRNLLQLKAHARQMESRLLQLAQEIEPQSPGGRIDPIRFEELKAEIGFANAILEKDSFRWTLLLDRLEEVFVEGVSLRSIHPDFREKSLNMAAEARDTETLRRFLDRLIASPHFAEVLLLRQAKVKARDPRGREREAVSFSLVLKEAF